MTALAVQPIPAAGITPTFTAATASDTMPCGPTNKLRVKNTSGGAITVTIAAVTPCNRGFLHDRVVSIPATAGDVTIGGIIAELYGDTTGTATITNSSTTGLTYAALSG